MYVGLSDCSGNIDIFNSLVSISFSTWWFGVSDKQLSFESRYTKVVPFKILKLPLLDWMHVAADFLPVQPGFSSSNHSTALAVDSGGIAGSESCR